MNLSNNSSMIKHSRGKHLSYEERVLIQIRRKDNKSMRYIARELSCSPQTISNEFFIMGQLNAIKQKFVKKLIENTGLILVVSSNS